jgi:methionyl-tRNA formyltransferase
MQIDEGLDTGPVYLCEKTSIAAEETVAQLSERLSTIGSELMIRTLQGIVAGALQPTPQDHSRASLAPILRKEDGYVDWMQPAQKIHNRVRAFNPWPGAVTQFRGVSCRILKSNPGEPTSGIVASGAIVVTKSSVAVVCGDGNLLELEEVQFPGRKPVSGKDFANGMRIRAGDCFERVGGTPS